MRITEVRGTIVGVPVRHRIVSAVREADRVINVLVEVLTDETLLCLVPSCGNFLP